MLVFVREKGEERGGSQVGGNGVPRARLRRANAQETRKRLMLGEQRGGKKIKGGNQSALDGLRKKCWASAAGGVRLVWGSPNPVPNSHLF